LNQAGADQFYGRPADDRAWSTPAACISIMGAFEWFLAFALMLITNYERNGHKL
jgi:hypothetical protein